MLPCLDDGAQHSREWLGMLLVARDEHRFGLEQHAERAQPVRAQRVPGGDEVDDRIGEPEPRRDLDRAAHVDQGHADREQLTRQARVDGCDRRAGELRELLHGRLLGNRRLEAARAEAEWKHLAHVGAALAHEVDAGDPAIDDTVLHVLGHVGGAHEQHLDGRVAARERERAIAGLLGAEARILQEVERRLSEASLDRDRDPQDRSSAVRYPPSPWRSQCATRVTVVVDAPVRSAISRYGSPCSTSRATSQRCAIASSSEIVQRSRKKLSVSARVSSDWIASKSSRISLVRHGCRVLSLMATLS